MKGYLTIAKGYLTIALGIVIGWQLDDNTRWWWMIVAVIATWAGMAIVDGVFAGIHQAGVERGRREAIRLEPDLTGRLKHIALTAPHGLSTWCGRTDGTGHARDQATCRCCIDLYDLAREQPTSNLDPVRGVDNPTAGG